MSNTLFAGAQASSNQKFNTPDNSRRTMNVRVDADGVVRAMYDINLKPATGSTEQIARTFLQDQGDALGLPDIASSLRTEDVKTIAGSSHVRFAQTFMDVPVYRGDVVVSINSKSEVSMAVNNFKNTIQLSTTVPSLTNGEAIQIGRHRVGINGRTSGKPDHATLMVFRAESGRDHLAYRVSMTNENPLGDWEVFVDATTGEVLSIEDLFVNERVQGSGYVYLSDPLSAGRRMYNATGFADNNDADSDSLTGYRTPITLDSLTYEDGVYKLKGPYCNVTDIESPADPQFYAATSPDGFSFTRSAQEFEAVNVYYNVSTAYKRLLDLGFSVPSLTQIRLDPHGYLGQDNSHFSPSGNWIAWGEGGVDDAEDADVIWHEYGHAIMYNIIPNWGGGESGALGEGFGDYWAGSYSRFLGQWAPTDFQYNWVFNWDGHNPYWLGRTLNDSRTYPFGNLQIHTAGQIWSSALMGIWNDLGRDITDRLVIKSFYYLGSGTTGIDAAQAIIQADRDLYNGSHIQTLLYWLGTVKHFIDPVNFLPTIAHTPLVGTQSPSGPFEIRATITSFHGLNHRAVIVVWGRGNAITDTTVMIPTQTPSEFLASIPGNGTPGIVRYYISATDTTGVVATAPLNAPIQNCYSFQVGEPSVSGVVETGLIPASYALGQNFPNPFNPTTAITYALPGPAAVTLKVYNSLGQEVASLIDQTQSAGYHEVVWHARNNGGTNVSSGIYFYRIEARSTTGSESFVQMKKMTLLR
jgi:zinc metalloprotease ZmpB